jgi:hypothetical protein
LETMSAAAVLLVLEIMIIVAIVLIHSAVCIISIFL